MALLAFLPGFFQLPPIDRDEPRYAQATSQMRESGDYLDIRFQNEPRHHQPIGIYWLQNAALQLAGYGDRAPIWVYRIPSLLGAVGAVVLTYWVALAFTSPPGAFMAGLFIATSVLLGVEARLAKTDAVLLAATLGAIGLLARAYLGQRVGLGRAMLFWVALAAGVMVKGPIILLVVGSTALALCIWDRSAAWLKALHPAPGIVLTLLLVMPWFIVIGVQSGGDFFARAVGRNLLGKVAAGAEGHGAPPGYYLALFWMTFLPAAVLAPVAARWTWQHGSDRRVRFCLAWIIPTWVVFELVVTKLPHYVLPTYPAIAVLTAMALLDGRQPGRILAGLAMAAAPGVAAAGPMLLYAIEGELAPTAAVVSLAGLVAAVLTMHRLRERPTGMAAGLATATVLLQFSTFGLVFPRLDSVWMTPRLAAAIARHAPCPDPAVASAGYHEPSLVFMVGTRTRLTFAEDAARFLAAGGCRIALIDARNERVFQAEIAAREIGAELRERVVGTPIGRLRRESVGVYVPHGAR
ncbi:MAG: glycosyltransferase family 39 protein [Alphaproteobacteria bacterium]|nr:glycosyltransferase family 39 protein [Alphaproteobacteria bacterium]